MLVTQHLSAQMFHILAVCLIFCMHYSIILSHFAAYLWYLECKEWESHDAPSTYSPLTVLPVHYMLLLDSLCSHFFFSIFPQPPTGGCLLLDTVGVLPVKTRGNLVLVHKGSLGRSLRYFMVFTLQSVLRWLRKSTR